MRLFLTVLMALATFVCRAQSMAPGQAYYIVNNYYDRALSYGDDKAQPRLSKVGTNPDETYVFDCIESAKEGFVYLKQRSSGLWLAASSSNTWSTVLTTEQNDYGMWRVSGGALANYKAQSKRLGIDTGQESSTYIGVYYDKSAGDASSWRFVKAVAGGYDASVKAAEDEIAAAEEASKNATFILSGDSLALGSSYTLGLEGLRFRSATDSAIVVLRNDMGVGTQIVMFRDRIVLADGRQCPYDGGATSTTISTLRFTCDNGQLTIERNDSLLAQLKVEAVPVVTTVGGDCEWTILRSKVVSACMPVIYSRTKALKRGEYETDKLGHHTFDVVFINTVKTLEVGDDLDVHILKADPIVGASQINIVGERSRVIFDNRCPSDVRNNLSCFKINGKAASTTTNCRVGIYLNGTVVFAAPKYPFIGYSGEQYTGDEIALSALGNTDLGADANAMRSFILRRGYMAVVASGAGQEGYTRVYVADHEDLLVPVLPDALNRRVSSVHIKQWQYVSKKGWCSTKGDGSIASDMKKLGATWFYTWSADRSCTDDAEYIPIRQHIWWPSVSQIGGHKSATACLMMNEPEHSEQHDNCDCKGVISEWNACTYTPSMGKLGMRVGSPAPTDAGWLTNFIGHVDDMAYRCDFVAIHCYWGTNEAANAQAWKSKLQDIYNKTKRPIWITEWNNGANWTNESWPSSTSEKYERQRKAIKEIVAMLESLDFVERYAIYNNVEWFRYVLYDDGGLTPAGREYSNYPSTFAYNAKVQKVPNWWAPATKDVTLAIEPNDDGTATFSIDNPNGDLTETLCIEQLQSDGTWSKIHDFTERYVFDESKQTVVLPMSEGSTYRAHFTRMSGGEKTSAPITLPALQWNEDRTAADATSYITNPDCTSGTSGWTVSNVSTNKGEASDGVSTNTYWNIWKSSAYTSSMTQELSNMPRGYYTLTTQLRGQEHIVQELQLTGDDETAKTTFQGTGSNPAEGSAYPMGWADVTTPEVLCLNGKLTIKLNVTNGSGAGWWSADNFKLTYRPDPLDGISSVTATPWRNGEEYDLTGRRAKGATRGIVISDGKKIIRR